MAIMATLKQNKITIHYTMEDNQTKKFLQTEILHGKHQYTKYPTHLAIHKAFIQDCNFEANQP